VAWEVRRSDSIIVVRKGGGLTTLHHHQRSQGVSETSKSCGSQVVVAVDSDHSRPRCLSTASRSHHEECSLRVGLLLEREAFSRISQTTTCSR
jgi:hypothetical protein